MQVFNRKYELTISAPNEIYLDPTPPVDSSLQGNPQARRVVTSDRTIGKTVITELQMECKVKGNKTNNNKNFTEIRLYNAPDEILNSLARPNAKLVLYAGYESKIVNGTLVDDIDSNLVFYGDVISSFTQRERTDIVTTIRAQEAVVASRDSYMSKYYPASISLQEIVTDIVENHYQGMTLGDISLTQDDYLKVNFDNILVKQGLAIAKVNTPVRLVLETYEDAQYAKALRESSLKYRNLHNGFKGNFRALGRVDTVLKKLSETFKFELYTIKNKVYAHPIGVEKFRDFYVITPEQIIGIVETAQNSTKKGNVEENLRIKIFLDGRLDQSKYVRLQGFEDNDARRPINGDYRVIDFEHDMNYRQKNWYTNLILKAV